MTQHSLQHNKEQKRMNNNSNSNQRKPSVQITVYVVKQNLSPPIKDELDLLLPTTTRESRGITRRQPLSPLKSPAGSPCVDRKAQLLLYSQQLRATATFLKHQPHPHHHKFKQPLHITHNKVKLAGAGHRLQITAARDDSASPWKVVEAVDDQQKSVEGEAKLPPPPPSCFGDWKKLFFPSFCAKDRVGHVRKRRRRKKRLMIVSLARKITAIMMSSRMEKERIGVIAKFLSVIGKHR